MKYTLCITQQCNMRCSYCYIGKKDAVMPLEVANKAVDFIFNSSPPGEEINVGFFGGEPLLEFALIKDVVSLLTSHRSYDSERTTFSLVTNGTIFDSEIADFLNEYEVNLCISADGPSRVQDSSRRFADGNTTATLVEKNIKGALEALDSLVVNAVYTPETLNHLPETVEYFTGLGLRRLHLSPDYSARWPQEILGSLQKTYDKLAELYISSYLNKKPVFINIIDNKMTAILRDGFQPEERCRMGVAEFAFAPSGNIYPCERLIGSDEDTTHAIGNLATGIEPGRMACRTVPGKELNTECTDCGVKEYCMNWCGCSNYFASGYYNRVSAFTCASEQSAIKAAFSAFKTLEERLDGVFSEHLSGRPYSNAFLV